ncbi:MAG: hypothetical protein ACOH19_10450 [Rhodoglobus sp.]
MTYWIARYEEGYVTADGETVTLSDELHRKHPWLSPEDAMRHWANRKDLAQAEVETYGNGLQQTDDVRARSEFAALGVTAVWRRVTFQTEVDANTT